MRAEVELTPQANERIAQRVAQLLRDAPPEPAETSEPPARLLSASELARHLGVTRPWVYQHAVELGARRLGDGPKARLRFELDTALEAWGRSRAWRSVGNESSPAGESRAASPTRRARRPKPAWEPGSILAIRPPGGASARKGRG